MKIDIDSYTFPFSKCPCTCGGAIDANGVVVVPDGHRVGDDPPSFADVMQAVAGGVCYGDEDTVDVGCKCGSWATYGKGGSGHSDWCPEYRE